MQWNNGIVADAARVTHITSPVMAASGEEVVMECEVDGVPRINGMVKWLRGDTVIDTVSFDGQTRAVLRLNASQETSGAYTCVADNGVGKVLLFAFQFVFFSTTQRNYFICCLLI